MSLREEVMRMVQEGLGALSDIPLLEKPLRVAIIGNGNIYNLAYRYLLRFLSSEVTFLGFPQVLKVVATCDVIDERARRAKEELNAEHSYESYRDLLKDLGGKLDAVIVATPTYTHHEIASEFLRAGIPVLLEKPMAHDLREAEELLEIAERSGVPLLVGHTRRFDPRWNKIREELASLGDVLFVRRAERAFLPFPKDSWHWKRDLGGGVHLDVGIHSVDLVNWLIGELPEEVILSTKGVREEASEVPDWAHFTLRYPRGIVASIEVSWAHPKVFASLYSYLEVTGTKGRISYDDLETNPAVSVSSQGISLLRYSPLASAPLDAFLNEVIHFIRVIRGESPLAITPLEAYQSLRVILEAWR